MSGSFIELPQSKFQQPISACSCPTHALALKASADGEIDVFLNSSGTLDTNKLCLVRKVGGATFERHRSLPGLFLDK
jgi:hypothetical protein